MSLACDRVPEERHAALPAFIDQHTRECRGRFLIPKARRAHSHEPALSAREECKMKRICLITGLLVAGLLPFTAFAADDIGPFTGPIEWARTQRCQGAEVAIVDGDPSKEGVYVIRLRVPAGLRSRRISIRMTRMSRCSPEHSTSEWATRLTKARDRQSPRRSFQTPKTMHHYAWFAEDTVLQLHGIGPGGIIYINPADDPRKTQ